MCVHVCVGLLDYEGVNTEFTITVQVDDSMSTVTVVVSVAVGAVNEGPPVFGTFSAVNLDEDHTVGALVFDVSAGMTDPDGTTHDHGGPRYTISNGNSDGKFTVDYISGSVSTYLFRVA